MADVTRDAGALNAEVVDVPALDANTEIVFSYNFKDLAGHKVAE
jgi:hypothetical protein